MSEEPNYTEIREKGRAPDGSILYSERRLFMQFLAFGDVTNSDDLIAALKEAPFASVLYADANDFSGVGLLTYSEDPGFFVGPLRDFLNQGPFCQLTPKPEFTMMGRTYTIGYESDLDHVLVNRPKQRVLNPELPWVVWYPLRRKGSFQDLDHREQMEVLGEHGRIGNAFGSAGLAQDIRLACFGIDKEDNDFVIGLLGSELFPLSAVVQTMRKTRQTAHFIEKLGPFFAGKAIWQSPAE